MVKYRGLKESDVERFVDDVLVHGKAWESGQEALCGAYVFVCARASGNRAGCVYGLDLIESFMEEITSRDLTEHISVYASAHLSLCLSLNEDTIFRTTSDGKVNGDWFSLVYHTDVPDLIDRYIGRGEKVEHIWRGHVGVHEDTEEEMDQASGNKEEKMGQCGSPDQSHCPIQ